MEVKRSLGVRLCTDWDKVKYLKRWEMVRYCVWVSALFLRLRRLVGYVQRSWDTVPVVSHSVGEQSSVLSVLGPTLLARLFLTHGGSFRLCVIRKDEYFVLSHDHHCPLWHLPPCIRYRR